MVYEILKEIIMTKHEQLLIITVGYLLGKDSGELHMENFNDMEHLRLYLNTRYDISISKGMQWEDVVAELKAGIDAKRFENAGSCI